MKMDNSAPILNTVTFVILDPAMQTLRLATDTTALVIATDLLRQGELVAVPTETVYGLAADARNPTAVGKIFTVKQRPSHHPLIVHLAATAPLTDWASGISSAIDHLAATFWPGPLTLLLPKAAGVSEIITGQRPSIGLRVPDQPLLQQLLERFGSGLAAPSANLHKHVSPTTPDHVLEDFTGLISAVFDAGPCRLGIESTILDCTQRPFRVLRPGPITASALTDALGETVHTVTQSDTAVPGNMPHHYQPKTACRLVSSETLPSLLQASLVEPPSCALLCRGKNRTDFPSHMTVVTMPNEASRYAERLYAVLRALDQRAFSTIYIEALPEDEAWQALRDRLAKACHH